MTVDARVELSARLRSYLEAWGTLDPLAVTDCYRADAVHRGPFVTMLCPELSDATVRGSEALADFVAKNPAAAGGAGYDHVVTWVLEDAGASVVEYEIHGALKIVEVIAWDGDKVQRVHAYTLPPLG